MNTTGLYIAGRYLFAKKSHNVINLISAVAVVGLAVGTAALILILSVYNGFDLIVRDNLSGYDPDVRIESVEGKVFVPEGAAFDSLRAAYPVAEVLEDNVFLSYGSSQGVARARGTADSQCSVGAGLARKMGISPRFLTPLTLYYPDRTSNISLSAPQNSLRQARVFPQGIFSISSDIDDGTVMVPLTTMRELLQYPCEVTALEIRDEGASVQQITELLGPGYRVLDRLGQHPSLYRMMRAEKAAIFLILAFVVLIVAFNIYGSLSMLILEKKEDSALLRSMGASDSLVRRIFALEGWLTSLLGMVIGLAAGVALALLQGRFGWVKMPGTVLRQPYPCVLHTSDVLLCAAVVAVIGLVVSLIPAAGSKTKVNSGI